MQTARDARSRLKFEYSYITREPLVILVVSEANFAKSLRVS